ncbi:MAG: insulinase family protein [Gemmatimonadetes bacterium]|nr:insulinase family protein [Gemmatimonadota bacterium]
MDTVRLDEGLNRSTAPNGLTILTEVLPSVRSCAIGLWVRSASAHEPRDLMGTAHLLEHLVFKGTERRSAKAIAHELEARGGSLDAYTGRDHTNFQAHILDADLPAAVDVLTDLVRRPLLRSADLDLERKVVLEEIVMVEDTPDDLVFDLHAEALWPSHPYGYSILGTRDTVSTLGTDALQEFHRAGYYPGNIVIAAAGRLDHDQVTGLLEHEGWFDVPAFGEARAPVAGAPASRGVERRVPREGNQVHVVIGTDTFSGRDRRRVGLALLVNALGGGMSSRLFQRVREELGLAYTVYSYQTGFQASGIAGTYVATAPGSADKAVAAILAEYALVARDGLPAEELEAQKLQLKGQIMLGLESPVSRMGRLAGFALAGDRYRTLDELLAEVDAVTGAEVAALGAEFFAPERQTIVRLGPEA